MVSGLPPIDFWSHRVALFRFMRSWYESNQDCEDLVSEALCRAYGSQNKIRDPKFARTWLFSIALNLARNAYRHGQKVRTESIDALVSHPPMHEDLDSRLAHEAWMGRIRGIPETGRSLRRQVLLMRLDGHDFTEIARALRMHRNTVKVHLHRELDHVARTLEPNWEKPERRPRAWLKGRARKWRGD